jgi:hypothetical protein
MCKECINRPLPGEKTGDIYERAGIPERSSLTATPSLEIFFATQPTGVPEKKDIFIGKRLFARMRRGVRRS